LPHTKTTSSKSLRKVVDMNTPNIMNITINVEIEGD
jgi:hypothetical protein